MGDCVWQWVQIGGNPGEHRRALWELIEACCFETCEEDGEDLGMEGNLPIGSYELDKLKAFLRQHGLSYNHHNEAKYEHEGEIWFWRPGMSEEKWSWRLQNGQETVTVNDLEAMAEQGLTLQQVIEKARVPELPAWVVDAAEISEESGV